MQPCSCRQKAINQRIHKRLFNFSHLDELQKMTFDSFQPKGHIGLGEQQQLSLDSALRQARAFAETHTGWLFIHGGYGCGKTHLAAAIGNCCVSNGVSTLFLTVPDLLDSLRFTFDNKEVSFESRFEEIRRAPLLILDDFGTQSATDWAREKLFQIINYRYVNRLPLVVTTNLAFQELDGRLGSRLSEHDMVQHIFIQAPDYRRPTEDTGQHKLSSLHLHPRQTFGTFNLRKSENLSPDAQNTLEIAFRATQSFSEQPEGWLTLTGPYGCGKTHLAAAVANFIASQGLPVMFIVVPDLLDHLRATFSPSSSVSYDRRFEEIRATPLLILDDLGTQAATPWVREKLFQLLNHRYNAQLPMVITTADTFDDIDPRLRSRMLDHRICEIIPITAPAYRGGRRKKK